MNITLYVRTGCEICESTQNQLDNLLNDEDNINYKIVNLSRTNYTNVQIVPALFVEDELYSYGELNEVRFKKMINTLSL